MAVLYKLYKIVREFKDGRTDKANNHWFARAINIETVGTDKLAEMIQEKCTVNKADVVAVLKALTTTMRDQMQNSRAVRLEGVGIFKIGLKTIGSETPGEFSVNGNITGAHVIFTPECKVDMNSGKRIYALLDGLKVQETPKNMVVTH